MLCSVSDSQITTAKGQRTPGEKMNLHNMEDWLSVLFLQLICSKVQDKRRRG